MNDAPPDAALPALNEALGAVPKSLVPATLKAIDRLVGGAIDIPAAWLAQKKAQIDAQTEAYKAVESAIAKAAASEAGTDPAIIGRAVEVLVRKSYREQSNREAVAKAAVLELQATPAAANTNEEAPKEPPPSPDEEWLNVFEQHAERASTERMQRLWGRVLAGEIRRPGRYSMRTLRFLSEFSQQDALSFAGFAASVFGDTAPLLLVKPEDMKDIRPLAHLEAAGLVHGATTFAGLTRTVTLTETGWGIINEGNLGIGLKGKPGSKVEDSVAALTPLGVELLSLVSRNQIEAAERVAKTFENQPDLEEIHLVSHIGNGWRTIRVIWVKDAQA